jgi:hypothetical protein
MNPVSANLQWRGRQRTLSYPESIEETERSTTDLPRPPHALAQNEHAGFQTAIQTKRHFIRVQSEAPDGHKIRNIDTSPHHTLIKSYQYWLMKRRSGGMQCSASLESWDFTAVFVSRVLMGAAVLLRNRGRERIGAISAPVQKTANTIVLTAGNEVHSYSRT